MSDPTAALLVRLLNGERPEGGYHHEFHVQDVLDGAALRELESLPAPDGFRRWVSISISPERLVGRYDVRTGISHVREGWPDEKRIGFGNTLADAVREALGSR